MHLRCCAHILNLIVKEGLKDLEKSVLRILIGLQNSRHVLKGRTPSTKVLCVLM